MQDLDGRVAVVVGASGGLGRTIAIALARLGAELVITSRNSVHLDRTAALILEETGRTALVVSTDVTIAADVEALKEQTVARFGAATILVNAAGDFGPLDLVVDSDPEEWTRTLLVNTVAPYLTCRAFARGMIENGWGRIVNVSSAASLYPPISHNSAYATSKVALNRMTRCLAVELDGTGVTANVIHPGSLKTEMWSDIRRKVAALPTGETALAAWVELVERTGGDALSRAADVVVRLVSDEGREINGQFCWPEGALEEPVPSW
jgi:NAD(P)-dependent dehydrogenase (short-subunit alcohol dehydrogenase family)